MSELDRLLGIIKKVYEEPQCREEYELELYLLHERDKALFEQTMAEMKELAPQLHRETVDFIQNIESVKDLLKKAEDRRAANPS